MDAAALDAVLPHDTTKKPSEHLGAVALDPTAPLLLHRLAQEGAEAGEEDGEGASAACTTAPFVDCIKTFATPPDEAHSITSNEIFGDERTYRGSTAGGAAEADRVRDTCEAAYVPEDLVHHHDEEKKKEELAKKSGLLKRSRSVSIIEEDDSAAAAVDTSADSSSFTGSPKDLPAVVWVPTDFRTAAGRQICVKQWMSYTKGVEGTGEGVAFAGASAVVKKERLMGEGAEEWSYVLRLSRCAMPADSAFGYRAVGASMGLMRLPQETEHVSPEVSPLLVDEGDEMEKEQSFPLRCPSPM